MSSLLRRHLHNPRHLVRWLSSSLKKTPFAGDEVLVPDLPVCSKIDDSLVPPVPEFDQKLINHLERLSLVRFSNEEAVANLREAVQRANRLQLVDVENLEPMIFIWEDQECPLHDDIPEQPLSVNEVLRNASRSMEDYFVTPPGNIPLEENDKPLDISLINEWDKRGVAEPPKPRRVAENNK